MLAIVAERAVGVNAGGLRILTNILFIILIIE